jgi:hypothetical protein
VPTVIKSGSLNFLEPCGPVQGLLYFFYLYLLLSLNYFAFCVTNCTPHFQVTGLSTHRQLKNRTSKFSVIWSLYPLSYSDCLPRSVDVTVVTVFLFEILKVDAVCSCVASVAAASLTGVTRNITMFTVKWFTATVHGRYTCEYTCVLFAHCRW